MLSILKRAKREIFISEPDLAAAHSHLKGLPLTKTGAMPDQWGREWLLQCLREALEKVPETTIDEGLCISFGPGLWAMIVPFGIDLSGAVHTDGRFQVWVLVRSVGTDPNRITKL